jgi:hypothetical protein
MLLSDWIRAIKRPSTEVELEQKRLVLEYRKTGNKNFKNGLRAFCPGAVLHSRSKDLTKEEKIERITGWMQFDIDAQDNPTIDCWESCRDNISNLAHVAFCSLSASAKGVWGLVKVKDCDNYRNHFEKLKLDFLSKGLVLDPSKGGNPTDLRYYTFDPEAYIASEFKLYERAITQTEKQPKQTIPTGDKFDQVKKMCQHIRSNQLDIAPNHSDYIRIGFALANEFGESGRELFHMACSPNPTYDRKKADWQYGQCVNSNGQGVTIGTFYYLYKQVKI